MSFQNAAALWALLPLAGIIVALYLLKMRRRDMRVPATFLWPERVEEIRANSLFQKLRFSWLLVLQLLALSLAVLALARPQTMQRGLTGKVTVLVIDSSASMAATDVKPSRFEEAKRLALAAVRGASVGDRIAIIEAGASPRVLSPLSSDPARQSAALDKLEQTDSESNVPEALRLAASLVGSEESARIVLLSDGVFQTDKNFKPGKASVVYQSIGQLGDNLAVSQLSAAETTQGRQVYCAVKNHGPAANGGSITLFADGKVLHSEKITIGPNATWGTTLPIPTETKLLEARIEANDLLAADNYAVAMADPGAALRVLLVSPDGDFFLERALALDPRVTLIKGQSLPQEEASGTGPSSYDLIVFDGVQEQPVRSRSVLTFGGAGDPTPARVTGSATKPRFLSAEDDRIMSGVNLGTTFIDEIQTVSPKADGEVLAQSDKGPLVVVSRNPKQRKIYVAFRPMNSDFPLQIGFPIFVANALDFFGQAETSKVIAVRAGEPFSVPSTVAGRLEGPNDVRTEIEPTGAMLVVRDAKRIGQYELSLGDDRRTVYAYLRSERESNLTPVQNLSLGSSEVRAVQAPMRFADFWKPLAILCLLILGLEWWMFARRS